MVGTRTSVLVFENYPVARREAVDGAGLRITELRAFERGICLLSLTDTTFLDVEFEQRLLPQLVHRDPFLDVVLGERDLLGLRRMPGAAELSDLLEPQLRPWRLTPPYARHSDLQRCVVARSQ